MLKNDISLFNNNQELVGRWYAKDLETALKLQKRDKNLHDVVYYTIIDITNVKHQKLKPIQWEV